jgi:dTDP-4-amino-4,6-dideoxygalactose transaminase
MGPEVERRERRDALAILLKAREIGCEAYYPVPLHLQGCFAPLGGGPGQSREAEQAARGGLALPIDPELIPLMQATVVSAILSFYS